MSTEEPPADDSCEDESDGTTETARVRWQYLSSVVTILYVGVYLTIALLVSLGHAQWPGGNMGGALMTGFLLFVVYVVGPGAVESYKKLKE